MGCFEIGVPYTICYYYYKRTFDSLDNGLLQLKIDVDVFDMTKWVPGLREKSLYVRHPTKEMVRSMLFGELYREVRAMWPKCVLKELEICGTNVDVGGDCEVRGVVDGNDVVGGDNDVDVHDHVVGCYEAQDVDESDRVDVGLDELNDDGFTMDGVYDDFFNDEGPNLAHEHVMMKKLRPMKILDQMVLMMLKEVKKRTCMKILTN
ncbi:hypothetical protein LIER_35967 [Lithospermum erythrorhizon]|uniref:Uncharacterized protein n=1 Tax=Lithospermum erythrorhizon TaxID=34254 RepID=A0AAV3P3K4_LITER